MRSVPRWMLAVVVCVLHPAMVHAEPTHINVAELDNQIISPVTQQYVLESLAASERDGAQ